MIDIQTLRNEINLLDTELKNLLKKRMELTEQVGLYKKEVNLPITDEKREEQILATIPHEFHNLWNELMDVSKQWQYRLHRDSETIRIAIQWGKGSFNERAIEYFLQNIESILESYPALQGFLQIKKEHIEIVYAYTTEEVLKMLARWEVDYGQFAIANSIGGLVNETLEALGKKHWNYITHYTIPIKHCLMIHPNQEITNITQIMGHEQAIRQCEETLKTHYPHIPLIPWENEFTDNAAIAAWIMNGEISDTTAAIWHISLAEIYNLQIVETDIQDRSDNMTSFVFVN